MKSTYAITVDNERSLVALVEWLEKHAETRLQRVRYRGARIMSHFDCHCLGKVVFVVDSEGALPQDAAVKSFGISLWQGSVLHIESFDNFLGHSVVAKLPVMPASGREQMLKLGRDLIYPQENQLYVARDGLLFSLRYARNRALLLAGWELEGDACVLSPSIESLRENHAEHEGVPVDFSAVEGEVSLPPLESYRSAA